MYTRSINIKSYKNYVKINFSLFLLKKVRKYTYNLDILYIWFCFGTTEFNYKNVIFTIIIR